MSRQRLRGEQGDNLPHETPDVRDALHRGAQDDYPGVVPGGYTQFFRNGIVEAVLSDVVMEKKEEGKLLLAGYYERAVTQEFRPVARLLDGLRQVGVQPPVWGFLTITGAKGARTPTDHDFGDESRAIDRDTLMLPEFVINDLGTDAAALLRPAFDLVWNASGFAPSFNFDTDGKRVGR